ncbi:beta-lactamase/transpeptidase-like protein [Favolaschia claudopus]|uniref:Beta-lactamase/transpeptidase-like protein n=1 Tax=Favolaschia claudopus TaxID=2862362 RepID=A0AAW0AUS1_9AGAR
MPAAISSAHRETLDRLLNEIVASKSTPAALFGVTNAEGPIYLHAEGTKLIDDPSSDAIDEDTVFWLCSQTKMITTIAALQLVDQGKITLDTPVETIIPELANPVIVTAHDEAGHIKTTVPATGKITLSQLLNHTSGLDYALDGTFPKIGPGFGMPIAYSHHYKEGEGVSKFFEIIKGSLPGVPLRFEPGTNFAYGFSSDCAGYVVERLSGKPLEQYLQDHVFAPLGITSMSFSLTPKLKERLLPLSYRPKTGVIERWNGPDVLEQDRANGNNGIPRRSRTIRIIEGLPHNLASSSSDFSASNPILSHASVDSMFTPTLPAAGADTVGMLVSFMQPHIGFPTGSAQFSYGLCVNTEDILGKRKKGTGCCKSFPSASYFTSFAGGGWASTTFWVDRATGVAAVFGTQLAPTGDVIFDAKLDVLERALYAGLNCS